MPRGERQLAPRRDRHPHPRASVAVPLDLAEDLSVHHSGGAHRPAATGQLLHARESLLVEGVGAGDLFAKELLPPLYAFETVSFDRLPGQVHAPADTILLDVVLPTGLGEARDALVARAGEVVIAIGGGYGTLAEVALALKAGTPVVGLDTWEIDRRGLTADPVERAESAAEAVSRAFELAGRGSAG